MKLGISLLISGLFLITMGFITQQTGFGFGALSSSRPPGPLEVLLAFWPGFLVFGFGLVIAGYFVGRRASQATAESNVTVKIDLPADVNLDKLKCQSCGGSLTTDNIKMVAGAPVVDCPYCHTTYQLTEEPKW